MKRCYRGARVGRERERGGKRRIRKPDWLSQGRAEAVSTWGSYTYFRTGETEPRWNGGKMDAVEGNGRRTIRALTQSRTASVR